jgi:cell division protein FtsQ
VSSAAERINTDPRLSRRRRAVERSRRRRTLQRSALSGALVVGLWVTFWSPLFQVRAVKVVGGHHTGAAAVGAAADLGRGSNLLLLSPTEVAAAARTLPWVRTARVQRMLPGTVKVRIVERRPAVVVVAPGGRFTVDGRGRVLQLGDAGAHLPELVCNQVAAPRPGDIVADAAPRAALEAFRLLPERVRKRVAEIEAASPERLTLVLAGGIEVRLGAAQRVRAKGAVLLALLARAASGGVEPGYIDVSVPESPATSPGPAPGAPSPANAVEVGPRR